MKHKLLKLLYSLNIFALFISYFYFFLHYSAYLIMYISSFTAFAFISDFADKFMSFLNFGVYYEAAAWIPIYVIGIVFLIALSCAVFFRKAISKKTYLLLILSVVPPLIVNLPSFVFIFTGPIIDSISPVIRIIWLFFSFICIILYIIFTMHFACKDFKSFGVVKNID